MAVVLGGVWLFSAHSPDSFALTVSGVSPTSGSPSGGETVIITGTGFADLVPGAPIDFSYTDAKVAQPYTPTANGVYQLEVWGAKGANYNNTGGAGGYSVGSVYLTAGTNLFVYVGGQGSGGTGGFNGGGTSNNTSGYRAGGGGGTDFRLVGGNWNDPSGLLSRFIVAGGGGGGNYLSLTSGGSGAGGGTNGGNGWLSSDFGSCTHYGGSQTAGGTYSGNACFNTANGGWGVGASGAQTSGGGGGWYGGAHGNGGGGGSGYVYTVSSPTPSGYLPGSEYYLTNAQTIAGNSSFPAPGGGTEVGHAGNGYARITPYIVQTPEVLFDSVPAVNCVVVNDTEMTCETPAHAAGTVPVTVGGTMAGNFIYLDPTPKLLVIYPDTGFTVGGETVTVTGENFINGDTAVEFGGAEANCTFLDATALSCITPAHTAGVVDVVVTTSDGSDTMVGGFEFIEPSLTLTVDKSAFAMAGSPDSLIADYLTANVVTDNPKGYNLTIEAGDVDLTCVSDAGAKITALPSVAGVMVDNHWGYAVGAVGVESPPSVWTGVSGSAVVVDGYGGATDLVLGRDTVVWFGTRVDTSLPACGYGGSVIFSAIVAVN
jgi:hypothetical protein